MGADRIDDDIRTSKPISQRKKESGLPWREYFKRIATGALPGERGPLPRLIQE